MSIKQLTLNIPSVEGTGSDVNLFIIRHAIAEAAGPGQLDARRALTRKGRQRFKSVVRILTALDLKFNRVYTSPWTRAYDTATLLSPLARQICVTELLAQPPGEPLFDELSKHPPLETVACIGHEPWLSDMIALLLRGSSTDHHRPAANTWGDAITLKKGGIVHLQGEARPGHMQLQAFLPPRWACRLATRGDLR